MLCSQLLQLDYSQWLPLKKIKTKQLQQLNLLLSYIKKESPFYKDRIASLSYPITEEQFQKIPLLTREELQEYYLTISCSPPKDHLPISILQSSGSTGQIVKVQRTALTQLMWLSCTMRDHLWHHRDFSQTLACIRGYSSPTSSENENWSLPASLLFETGIMYKKSILTNIEEQAIWLLECNPHYLLTYPTNLVGLLDQFEKLSFPSNLVEIRTIGETVTDELRVRCQKIGLKLTDNYSSQETGIIALECPLGGLYHVQSEHLLVELLDEHNNPCKEGQVGKVVITDLHNFATPLIRYDIQDYAIVGGPCPCGRGLPTLSKIAGRRRNMIRLPDGQKRWPSIALVFNTLREFEIKQYQLIQRDKFSIEVNLVTTAEINSKQQMKITHELQAALGYPFSLTFNYSKELMKNQNGKFEEFIYLPDLETAVQATPLPEN